jgi:hypothetical protein
LGRVALLQDLGSLGPGAADQGAPVLETAPSGLEREGHVGKIPLG